MERLGRVGAPEVDGVALAAGEVAVGVGIGAGLSFPSVMTLAMSGVRPEEAGLASGLVNTTLQVGGALGLAVLATLSTSRTSNLVHGGDTAAAALTSGYRLAFVVGAALVIGAVAIALAVLHSTPPAEEAVAVEAAEAEPAFSSEAA